MILIGAVLGIAMGIVATALAIRGVLGAKVEALACQLCDVEETKETP